MSSHADDYSALSIAERIQLVEDIWDSIPALEPGTLQFTNAQQSEFRRRAKGHRVNPETSIPLAQVRDKLFNSSS